MNRVVALLMKSGFAISGGVDSMALAALFANPESLRKSERCRLEAHAFIVDHKVRPESTEEAEWVAEQCRTKCNDYTGGSVTNTNTQQSTCRLLFCPSLGLLALTHPTASASKPTHARYGTKRSVEPVARHGSGNSFLHTMPMTKRRQSSCALRTTVCDLVYRACSPSNGSPSVMECMG